VTLPRAELTASGVVILHRAPWEGVILDALLLSADEVRAIREATASFPHPHDAHDRRLPDHRVSLDATDDVLGVD
jgi:hypothetical protein